MEKITQLDNKYLVLKLDDDIDIQELETRLFIMRRDKDIVKVRDIAIDLVNAVLMAKRN